MSHVEASSEYAAPGRLLRHASAARAAVTRHPGLWAALALGVALKAVVLATGSVTFDSDEAILALMARHTLQGHPPLFFYGQAYMGALDAYLIALAFLVFGQTVLAVRLTQTVLYLGVIATTYAVALNVRGSRRAATIAALLIALPPVLVSLYTTATLGNYVETLVLNNLLLLTGWSILREPEGRPWRWAAAGLLAGVGWWSMALIVVAAAPLAVLIGLRVRGRTFWRGGALAAAGFAVGALPWLASAALHPATFFAELGGGMYSGLTEGALPVGGLAGRLLSLLTFNLPALFGLRPPWSVEWIALPVGLLVTPVYLFALWWAVRRAAGDAPPEERVALASLIGGWAVLVLAFVLTSFGSDVTGRYLLPLYPFSAALVGNWLDDLRGDGRSRWLAAAPAAILALMLAYNGWGNLRSMRDDPPGLTTQFDPITRIPHDHDDALIAFLDGIGADRGYSNYWVAYRFAFLTGERILLVPKLPDKADLRTTDRYDRYPPYDAAVAASEEVVYVTSNHPLLDSVLRERFAAAGVAYAEHAIGPYTVFYDLSRPVRPDELGAFSAEAAP